MSMFDDEAPRWRGREANGDSNPGGSLRTDAPTRWRDVSAPSEHKPLTDDEITKAIERRFGISPKSQRKATHPLDFLAKGAMHSIAAGAALHSSMGRSGDTKVINGEVLEPHSLPPGTAPTFETTPMQEFCGSPTSNWGPIVGAHLSPCFVQTFLFGLVNAVFLIAAVYRLKGLLSTPPPPPRSLTRPALLKVCLAGFMAVYLIIMFAIHLAFDYGAPYQWLAYPSSCVTWSLCVAVLLFEARVGAPTNWVCRFLWISSLVAATFLLWSNLAEMEHIATSDLCAFAVHYALYVAMGCVAVFLREDPHDYSKLALDFSEMSFDEDKGSVSEDQSAPAPPIKDQNRDVQNNQSKEDGDGEMNSTFRRILALCAQEKWFAMASVVCCFIGAPIEIVQFIYIGMVVDDCAVPDGPRELGRYVAVLVALYLIEGVASASQLMLSVSVGEKMSLRLRRQVFSSIIRQDILYLESGGGARAQDLCNRLEKDVQRVQDATTLRSSMLLQSLIQILVGSVFLWALSWKLTLISLAILPIMALLMLAQSTILQSYSKRTVEVLGQVESLTNEIVSNVQTVRSLGREAADKSRLGQELLQSYRVARAMGVAHGVAEGVGVLVLKACMVLGILYGGTLVHDGDLSGGILVSYLLIALQVVMALSVLPPLVGDVTKALASGQRVFDVLDRVPQVKSRGGLTLASIEGGLELKQVSFFYPHQPDVPALNRLSITVQAGTHLAVCGASGSGKSTLAALLLRFFDAHEGLVLLDDTEVSSFDTSWLRQQVALVPQHPVVFACSIADNIAYGMRATAQQIQAASEEVGLHGLVVSLPEGYETELDPAACERGAADTMRRLIGLARASLRNTPVLLLDDALAGLQGAAREAAARGLARMTQGRTTLSLGPAGDELAQRADLVAVLSRGSLVELGSHAELLRRQGLYRALALHPAGGGPLAVPAESPGAPRVSAGRSRVAELLEQLEEELGPEASGAARDELARLRACY